MLDSSIIAELSGLLLLWITGYALDDCRRRLLPGLDRTFAIVLVAVLAVFVVKLAALPFFPGYPDDIHAWEKWSATMAVQGPHAAYEPPLPADYPPAYLYALWAAGAAAQSCVTTIEGFRLFLETPPLLADVLLALLVFAAVFHYRRDRVSALVATALFALNPALLYDTVVWGQADSVLVLPILLAGLLFIESRFVLGWAIAGLAALVKPQALLVLPVFALWTVLKSQPRTWGYGVAAFLLTVLVGFAPFLSGHPWYWPFSVYAFTASRYRLASMNAFNLMAVLGGLDRPEYASAAGISYIALGTGLLAALYLGVAFLLWRKPAARMVLIAMSLVFLGFFVFAARVHERYLYPALALMTVISLDAPAMLAVFIVLSTTMFINLVWVMRFHLGLAALAPNSGAVTALGLLNVACFAVAAFYAWVVTTPNQGLDERWPRFLRWFFGGLESAVAKPSPAAMGEQSAAKARRPASRTQR